MLVVDDDARVRETLKRFLEAGSHTVELAETGAEGLEKQRKGVFDLVIVDRAMPDMGGDKLAGLIKDKNPDLPIIMLTGFGGVLQDTPEAPRNVDTILGKPVAYRELQNAIADVMTDRAGSQRLIGRTAVRHRRYRYCVENVICRRAAILYRREARTVGGSTPVAETKTKNEIVTDIKFYIANEGGRRYRQWYVGVSKDAKDRLFNGTRCGSAAICGSTGMRCPPPWRGKWRITLVNMLGMDGAESATSGGTGGGDDGAKGATSAAESATSTADMVYAYKKSAHTEP